MSNTPSISHLRLPFLALSQLPLLPSTPTCLLQNWLPWRRNSSPIFARRTMTCVRLQLCSRGASLELGVYLVRTSRCLFITLSPTNGRRRSVAAATRGASVATWGGSRARCCPREARRKNRPTVCPAGAFGFAYRPLPTLIHLRNLTQVDGLSELFVMWDETLRRAEDRVTKLEKEREERSRRGYD